jgi:hypothetical protein
MGDASMEMGGGIDNANYYTVNRKPVPVIPRC